MFVNSRIRTGFSLLYCKCISQNQRHQSDQGRLRLVKKESVVINSRLSFNSKSKHEIVRFNPITYGWGVGGGGLLARTIRLLTITLKQLNLAPPNLVTFTFYLLVTFWQNFNKINLPGGLLGLFLK